MEILIESGIYIFCMKGELGKEIFQFIFILLALTLL